MTTKLLAERAGIETRGNKRVVVIGARNRPVALDRTLLRYERINIKIEKYGAGRRLGSGRNANVETDEWVLGGGGGEGHPGGEDRWKIVATW